MGADRENRTRPDPKANDSLRSGWNGADELGRHGSKGRTSQRAGGVGCSFQRLAA